MIDIDDIKAAARNAAYARRKAAKAAAPHAAEAAAERFMAEIPVAPGEVVSGYRPIRTELDPTPLLLALMARGAQICIPVIMAAATPLRFARWTPETPMVKGAFGAEIPAEPDYVTPSLLIAPLLAFDGDLWRLGYGGGFYDRTLAQLRAQGRARAVGYAYPAQAVPEVPTDPNDQRLDAVVTEAFRW